VKLAVHTNEEKYSFYVTNSLLCSKTKSKTLLKLHEEYILSKKIQQIKAMVNGIVTTVSLLSFRINLITKNQIIFLKIVYEHLIKCSYKCDGHQLELQATHCWRQNWWKPDMRSTGSVTQVLVETTSTFLL